MERVINVAVIGTGFGALVHIPGYRLHDQYRVIGVLGNTYEKAQAVALHHQIKAYASEDELFSDEEVDLVSIAAIPRDHFHLAQRALSSGKHVILEKPMAMNGEESEGLLRLAEMKGKYHAIVHEHRFDPARQYAKSLIQSQAFGKPRSIEIVKHMTYWSHSHEGRNHDWFAERSLGGGMKGAHLSHMIDFLHDLDGIPLGEAQGRAFTEVNERYSSLLERMVPHTSDDNVTCMVSTRTGIPVTIHISASRYRPLSFIKIFTSEGEIVIHDQNSIEIFDRQGKLTENIIPDPFLIPQFHQDFRLNTFVCLIDKFYKHYYCRQPQEITTFREGHEIQMILDQIPLVH